jgi:iron-sulfur cluster repair protein YtfE (RIC family)
MNPIDHLLAEHKEIMAQVADLRRALGTLSERGPAALPEVLPAFRSVTQMMATTLLRHARKEDEALFPALEAAWGRVEGTPTAIMRMEHSMIHNRANLFRETLRQLNEIEHPAIVSQGAQLQNAVETGADVEALQRVGDEIVRLLDAHFGKEEAILFPMAREILAAETLAAVMRRIEEIPAG